MAGPDLRGNARVIRDLNERAVLTVLRRRTTASKSEIAEALGLSTNTVGLICAALAERGLVAAAPKRHGLRGQPATPMTLDPAGAFAIGIKLGRRTQHAVLVDFAGTILESRSRVIDLPLPDEAVALIGEDIAAFRRLLPRGGAARLAGIGVAMPYNLDRWRRELDVPEAVGAAWGHFDLRAELAATTDTPILVDNDGTAAAAAELYQGCGRQHDDFALVHIGAALGGGLVLDGIVRTGRTGNAADFGLMPVGASTLASAPRPPAGLPDILLNRASLHSLIRHLVAGGLEARLSSDLDRAIGLRPELVDEWMADCVEALIRPLYTLASLLDLETIVLDGLLPRALMERLLAALEVRLATAAPEARRPPRLILGTAGRAGAAAGAAFLAFAQTYGPTHPWTPHTTTGARPEPADRPS